MPSKPAVPSKQFQSMHLHSHKSRRESRQSPKQPAKPEPIEEPSNPGSTKDADAKHAAMATAAPAKRKAPSEMPAMDTRRSSLAGLVKLLSEPAPQVPPAPTKQPPASNSRNSSLARFFGEAEIFPDEGRGSRSMGITVVAACTFL